MLIIKISIDKGVITGIQQLIMEMGVAEEGNIRGSFLEGEMKVKVEILDPRSGEVIETRNEVWTLLDEQVSKNIDGTELIMNKTDCTEGIF